MKGQAIQGSCEPYAEMEVIVPVEGGAEPVQETHGPQGGPGWSGRQASLRVDWRARRRMWRTALAVRGLWWRKGLRRLGTESTHWRTGTWGKTWSTRWKDRKSKDPTGR